MDKIFKPKVDKLVILRSAFILMVLPLVLLIPGSWNTTIAAGIVITECLLLIPFGIILPLRTTYKVTPEGLLIVPAGIRSIRIDIRDITSIGISNSWNEFFFRSYVNSLDQLKLSCRSIQVLPFPR